MSGKGSFSRRCGKVTPAIVPDFDAAGRSRLIPRKISRGLRLCAVLAGVLAVCGLHRAAAAEIDLVAPLGEFQLLEPPLPPPPGGPRAYGASGPRPRWAVVQWNIPGEKLPEFRTSGSVLESRTQAAGVRLVRGEAGSRILVHQDGSFIPCETDKGQPREWDLFLSPVGTHPQLSGETGMLRLGPKNPRLSEMDRLMEYATVSVSGGAAPRPKGCRVNMGNGLMALYISNTVSNQTMSYQLKISRVCGQSNTVHLNPCGNGPTKQEFYFGKNPFGVDDVLPLNGQPWVTNGQPRKIAVDILPRLLEAIRSAPASMDHDLSHWFVNSIYIGQHIWGDIDLTTEWQDFRLVAVTH